MSLSAAAELSVAVEMGLFEKTLMPGRDGTLQLVTAYTS